MERIPVENCIRGGIYRLHSRNLDFGVFDGEFGFAGIREKFFYRSLFTEYHYDQGAPYGTVSPLELVGNILPTLDPRGGWWEDHEYINNHDLFSVLENYEAQAAHEAFKDGKLWMGNGMHKFWLLNSSQAAAWDSGGRLGHLVDAETYFEAQDKLGVCMGVHHFNSPEISGRVNIR